MPWLEDLCGLHFLTVWCLRLSASICVKQLAPICWIGAAGHLEDINEDILRIPNLLSLFISRGLLRCQGSWLDSHWFCWIESHWFWIDIPWFPYISLYHRRPGLAFHASITLTMSLAINFCSLASSNFSFTCSAADFGSLPFRIGTAWPAETRWRQRQRIETCPNIQSSALFTQLPAKGRHRHGTLKFGLQVVCPTSSTSSRSAVWMTYLKSWRWNTSWKGTVVPVLHTDLR